MNSLRPKFNMRNSLCTLIITSGLALSGCATFVDSKVANNEGKGFVYYLPMPVIVVTPQADGTAKVEVEYLPDESKAYTLRARSLVSSYTLDVQTENGLLKTVSLDADSAQVTKAAVDAASTIADKVFTAAQAEREKNVADRKAREAKERELRQTVAVAKQELAALELLAADSANGIAPAQITTAKLSVIKAETILAVFLTEDVEDISALGDDGGSFDTAKEETAPGPVLFQVQMNRDVSGKPTLKLRAMAAQQDFETATVEATKPPAPSPSIPKPIRSGIATVSRVLGAATDRIEKFNTEITTDEDFLTESEITAGPINDVNICTGATRTLKVAGFGVRPGEKKSELILSFPPQADLPDGTYCISVVVKGKGLDEPTSLDLFYRLTLSRPR